MLTVIWEPWIFHFGYEVIRLRDSGFTRDSDLLITIKRDLGLVFGVRLLSMRFVDQSMAQPNVDVCITLSSNLVKLKFS